ncbi:MAG: lysylphosphatidylglycerol synthase transmembrane domain-containing protein [Desulfobacteraceae bacterium]|nr:lysylphosphatidylglycerol synthase transmembrane domain-containing protein [Desulfobacteraceae bacterium]
MNRSKLAGKLLLSGGLLAYLFWKFPAADTFAAMRETRLLPFAGAALTLFPITLLGGCQALYMTRAQGIPLSLRDMVRINLATAFYALFLPGVLAGGAVKWYKLARAGSKPAQAAAVVLFNRYMETFAVVLVGVLFLLPDPLPTGGFRSLKTASLFLLVLFLIGYGLLLLPRLPEKAERWIARLPLPQPVQEKRRKLLDAMQRFQDLRFRDHAGLHGVLLLRNGVGILSTYLLARSLDLDISLIQVGWVRSVMALIATLPLSFSGLGVREGTLVVLLSGYGVPPAQALAFSFLIFLRGILLASAGGLLELHQFLRKPLANGVHRYFTNEQQ